MYNVLLHKCGVISLLRDLEFAYYTFIFCIYIPAITQILIFVDLLTTRYLSFLKSPCINGPKIAFSKETYIHNFLLGG
jgi:hypothetical protein